MTPTRPHSWEQIADLSENWQELFDPSVPALVNVWLEQAQELRARDSYNEFLTRLQRQFAIETGAIEEVYKISEGATRTLIAKGLDAALISHEDTEGPPDLVVSKITDQFAAIEGLYQFVSSQRNLTKSYICEMHQVLTAHQDVYDGRDTLGNFVKRPLPRGVWKKLPNNVEGPNGFVCEFCPPEQVESEMDRLLALHREHVQKKVSPLIEAAWLHHRFSLIHPFTDGNGRMARCLATLVLVKENWFPLVVTRVEKVAYINALRKADDGDMTALVQLFGMLQRKVIREALSLAEETTQETTKIRGILESVRIGFERRRDEKNDLVKRSFDVADTLQLLARARLEEVVAEVCETLKLADDSYNAFAYDAARNSEKAGYHRFQIVQCARRLGYFANLPAYSAWVVLALETDVRTEILFSFHVIGRESSGILGCAAMIYTKRPGDDGKAIIGDVTPLASEPFAFAYAEEPDNVQRRFSAWLEVCLVEGLAEWKNEVI